MAASLTLGSTCAGGGSGEGEATRAGRERSKAPSENAQASTTTVYSGALAAGWEDWGWAPRQIGEGKPARLDLSSYGGWILAHPGGALVARAVTFRFRPEGEAGRDESFLEVKLAGQPTAMYRGVRLEARHLRDGADGFWLARVPMEELNPEGVPFDRVVLRAFRPPAGGWAQIDDLALVDARPATGPMDTLLAPTEGPPRSASFTIDCAAPPVPISPLIYGIAYSARHAAADTWVWDLGATARRWGGNPTSRFNWRLGNAWNTANDWFFMNVNPAGDPSFHWSRFLDENRGRGVKTALTVPLLGWVAKDTESYSFPVSEHGPQQATSPEKADVGNGVSVEEDPIQPAAPTRTSVRAEPSFVEEWVREIRKGDGDTRRVHLYFLDNEPMLWSSTHRDVHPEPVSYDELLDRTLRYGRAVRRADPEAKIAGPSSWGWPAYFYSAVDQEKGLWLRPDRRKHGDVPLLNWYLKQLRAYEKRTGERLLDTLDIHFYPQGEGVYSDKSDPLTAALRIRSTRALWDWSYVDESWIGEPIALLPRMKKIIDESYPGLGLSIGEYSFGGEGHMSGALALAEALGRFGEHGVTAAFYWTYPGRDTPAFWTFRGFRNYDGKGARFLDLSIPASEPDGASLFASRDEGSTRVVAVALNFERETPLVAEIALAGCRDVRRARLFTLSRGRPGLVEERAAAAGAKVSARLPAYSVSFIEAELAPPAVAK